MRYSKGWGAVLIIILLLLLDQALKIWIKTHMQLHESIEITPWFYLYFTENPGMAFGIEVIGKLFLSVFRIVAVLFIGYYLYKLVKENYKFGFIACISLVFAGAVGNIIDSIFYGVIFDHSFGQLATFMPEGGGYASWRMVRWWICLIPIDRDRIPGLGSDLGWTGVRFLPSDL